jgi:ankyrin repeat protein
MLRRAVYGLIALTAAVAVAASAHAAEGDLSVNARLLLAARNADAPGLDRALKAVLQPTRATVWARPRCSSPSRRTTAMAKTMLDAGTDVNLAALNGVTPLMAAAYGGQIEFAAMLLARGASINAMDRLRKNAMTYAAGEGQTDIVLMFLAKGVDPNAVYHNDLTAIMWAAGSGRTATVRALLAAGAVPGLKDNRGKTALDMARENRHEDTARLLETARKT